MTETHQPKTDRSAAVKSAILDSARRLFSENGFEATRIGDIAGDAQVNPAIVIRHFVSKENLFVQSVDSSASWRALLSGPLDQLGHQVVGAIARSRSRGSLQVFGATVRASGRPDIQGTLKDIALGMFAEPLISRIPGRDAELRAHLFAAQLFGLLCALAVYDDDYLEQIDEDALIAYYGTSLQELLTGPSKT